MVRCIEIEKGRQCCCDSWNLLCLIWTVWCLRPNKPCQVIRQSALSEFLNWPEVKLCINEINGKVVFCLCKLYQMLKYFVQMMVSVVIRVGLESVVTDVSVCSGGVTGRQKQVKFICVCVDCAGYKWAESLNFQRLVSSKLNPLRVCLPLVCTKFASVTRY